MKYTEVKHAVEALSKIESAVDENGWYEYPTLAPEDPEANIDDMPKLEDYTFFNEPGYDKDRFEDERATFIDQNFTAYPVWVKGEKQSRTLYWTGNNEEWMDYDGNKYDVIAWKDPLEEPDFGKVA